MEIKEKIFAEELQRTLVWISRNHKLWISINNIEGCTLSVEEISKTIDMFIGEKMYIPLVLFLANDFIGFHNGEMVRRILVDTLIGQWSEDSWSIAMSTVKETVAEYIEENELLRGETQKSGV